MQTIDRRREAHHRQPASHHAAPARAAAHPPPPASMHRHRSGRRGARLLHFVAEYLLLLPLGAAIALVWVNTAPESYFRTTGPLHFVVNDIGMVFFFGLIVKEVVEATLPGGVLHPWRRAALPMVAAVGLTLVPLAVFALVVPWFDEPRVFEGWPAVFATDIGFGYFVVRLLFGRAAAVPFFLLLAICANVLGVLALAAASATPSVHPAAAAALMLAALTVVGMLRRLRVRNVWPYLAGGGGLSWCALYFGGLEPAFALLPILPFVPHAARDRGFFVDAPSSAHDPLNRFEILFRHPAQIAMLLFGVVAAGVPVQALDWGTLSLPLTVLVAKPIGLLLGVGTALAFGLHLPHGIRWRELFVIGLIATIGFTVALFFAAAAVGPGPTLSALKMGALISVAGGGLAFAAAVLLRLGRFARPPRA
jgi:Na+:H+ antiporter, NhaA family